MVKLSQLASKVTSFINGGLYDLLDRGNWQKGNVLYVETASNGNQNVVSAPLITFLPIVTQDSDLTQEKTATFADVFNKWTRISLDGDNAASVSSELDTWNYDVDKDQVICTVNSTTTVGFISPEKYDKYTLEVEVSSNNADDDSIGLCLAYIVEDGIPYSLMLYRSAGSNIMPDPDGGVYPLQLVYRPAAGDNANERVVGGVTGTLQYPDGTAIGTQITTNGQHGGWDTLGAIRLKVERTSSQLKIWTTDKGSNTYDDANSFTVDLSSQSYLQRFMAPCSIGYIAYSQPNATFSVLQQPGTRDPIFDARDGSVWQWENGGWVQYPAASDNIEILLPANRLYSSTVDNGLYFTRVAGVLTPVGKTVSSS